MKNSCLSCVLVLFFFAIFTFPVLADSESGSRENPSGKTALEFFGKLPLSFVENRGQFDESVTFIARAPGATMYFTPSGAIFHFAEKETVPYPVALSENTVLSLAGNSSVPSSSPRRELAIRVSFPGANDKPVISGQDELEGKVNVFRGNDPDKWLADIPAYRGIIYRELWEGIDLVYYGMPEYGLKYDLILNPGADPALARMQYEGHEGLRVNSNGDLVIETAFGPIVEKKPYIYQDIEGERIQISGSFVVTGDIVSWQIEEYDTGHSLVIDPGLVYSTFIGGADYEESYAIAIDDAGNAYITGFTESSDFPTTAGAYDTSYNGNRDAFVLKLNSTGTALIYSTFLGGSNLDTGNAIAIDDAGNAYITGHAESPDFPTTAGAYDTSHNGNYDVFVTKLNPEGNALVYSTLLGGIYFDYGRGIAIDASGNVFIAGTSNSSGFPTTPGVYDTSLNGGTDIFVTKLNPDGSDIIYSTFLGGDASDRCRAIAIDASGNVYVTGDTTSTDFPTTPGAYDTSHNGSFDLFVTKLNSTFTNLIYSTLIGGNDIDIMAEIQIDASGNAYLAGRTYSSDFPTTPGAYDTTFNGGTTDAFALKLSPDGSNLIYSTFLGGSESDQGTGIAIDSLGNAYIAGYTFSTDFPTTPDAYDTSNNGSPAAFVTKLNPDGSALIYSTYLGGVSGEICFAIKIDVSNNVYITGTTSSHDFPTTPGAYNTSPNGYIDLFAVKLALPRYLTISSGAHGSVTVPGEGVFMYEHGDVVPVTAQGSTGYALSHWTGTAVTAGSVADPYSPSTTVTINGDYTLIANFIQKNIVDVERDSRDRIVITWESDTSETYSVWASTSKYNYNEALMTWTAVATDIPGLAGRTSWTDTNTPTSGSKYYTVVWNRPLFSMDTVGMRVINCSTGRNLVSSPFEPYPDGGGKPGSASLDKIVGNQLTGSFINYFSDYIERWDGAINKYRSAWLNTGTGLWEDYQNPTPPRFSFRSDIGYWFNILAFNPPRDVTLFGRVSQSDRVIDVDVGRNLLGSCFPIAVSLDESGLVESGFTGNTVSMFSDYVEFWNPATIKYDAYWYNTFSSRWVSFTGVPLRNFVPGEGFWVNVLLFNPPFTWTYPRP